MAARFSELSSAESDFSCLQEQKNHCLTEKANGNALNLFWDHNYGRSEILENQFVTLKVKQVSELLGVKFLI